jgi:hypothetical protein
MKRYRKLSTASTTTPQQQQQQQQQKLHCQLQQLEKQYQKHKNRVFLTNFDAFFLPKKKLDINKIGTLKDIFCL